MKLAVRDTRRDDKIIELYHSKGLTHKEIGKRLGITKARVGQLYRRIMRESGFPYKKPKNKVK